MGKKRSQRIAYMNRFFTIVGLFGLLITSVGLGLDFVPGSSSGISFPQLIVIVGGIVVSIIGFTLRNTFIRQHLTNNLFKNLLLSVAVFIILIIALEFILILVKVPTRYPVNIPEMFLKAVPWWVCDEAGCHYDYNEMLVACENKEVSGRRCMLNPQGFHDSQEFIAQDNMSDRLRVLMLGDSFTFGGTASIGNSFVETIETQLPNAIVWNTGIPGAGTNQAVASLTAFAPLLKPQIVVLGFYMNDFEDNLYPIDSYFVGVDENYYPFAIRQYRVDAQGKVSKMDSQTELYYRFHQVDPPSHVLEQLIGTTRLGSLLLNTVQATVEIVGTSDGIRTRQRTEVTRRYLTQLQDYTKRYNIQFLILLIPRRADIGSPGSAYQNAIDLLEDLNIAYLNPIAHLDVISDYAPEPDIHWSTVGHQKIGLTLVDCLEQFQRANSLSDCESVKN